MFNSDAVCVFKTNINKSFSEHISILGMYTKLSKLKDVHDCNTIKKLSNFLHSVVLYDIIEFQTVFIPLRLMVAGDLWCTSYNSIKQINITYAY